MATRNPTNNKVHDQAGNHAHNQTRNNAGEISMNKIASFLIACLLAVTAVGFLFAALPAVLVRFTYLFNTAYAVKPPDRPSGGPTDWDNSYYALIWHTWRFQPIRWHLARIPDMFTNTRNASGRRFDLWWLRPTAYGWGSVLCFWVLPTVATVAGIWMLRRYRSARDDEAVAAS